MHSVCRLLITHPHSPAAVAALGTGAAPATGHAAASSSTTASGELAPNGAQSASAADGPATSLEIGDYVEVEDSEKG